MTTEREGDQELVIVTPTFVMRTRVSATQLLLFVFAVVGVLQRGCSANQGLGQYRSTLFFDRLLKQLKEKDPTAFTNEASQIREPDSPSLQNLTDMYNEFDRGEFPQYMLENNYTLVATSNITYNYSNTNVGIAKSLTYATLQSDGDVGTYSAIEFNFIVGSIGQHDYTAGTCFYINARYTKGESFLNFQSSILGSILGKMPKTDYYISHGNFTGIGQGNGISDPEEETAELSVNTLGILHTAFYHSKHVMSTNYKESSLDFSNNLSMYSLTGGTNTTMYTKGSYFPSEDITNMTMDGTLKNPGSQATLDATVRMKSEVDLTDSFSDTNLLLLLTMPRSGADVYLYP